MLFGVAEGLLDFGLGFVDNRGVGCPLRLEA